MKQYMAVSNDRFELPLCCKDTAQELGDALHLTKQQIFERISRTKKHSKTRGYYKLLCVDIGDPYKTERGDFIGNNIRQAGTSKGSSKACPRRQG